MSERIHGYELLSPLQNQDAGFSRWTYAMKNGTCYFLKELLNPVYPDEESLSETLRHQRIQDCKEYEAVRKDMYARINEVSDGNLVRITEFFRCNSHYYIAMPKIDSKKLSFEEIAAQPLETRLLLCKTIAHSLMQLHAAHIVHADIKENNILIRQSATGKLIGKLIDFGCSFIENNPPMDEDELGGDQVYLAPESCQFMCGDSIQLTCQIDVFALGLLFHQYLTGELPAFQRTEYDYAYESVLEGQELEVSALLPRKIRELIRKMLCCDPNERCTAKEVFQTLSDYTRTAPVNVEKSFFHSAGDL